MKNHLSCFLSFIALLMLFCLPCKSYGVVLLQTSTPAAVADSLIRLLGTTSEDTAKVALLNEISWQHLNIGEYEQAIAYSQKAIAIAEKNGDKKGVSSAYANMGVAYWYKGESEKALENHQKCLAIRMECGDIRGVGNAYNNIGLVYVNTSDYEKSLTNYLKAIKIKEELGDKKSAANTYNNIGVIYDRQGNYDKALEYYEKALQLRLETNDKRGMGMSYNNIGIVYFGRKEYAQSLKNLAKAIAIRDEVGDKKGLADSYINTGNVYFLQGKYDKAQEYYFKAAGINENIGNKRGIALGYSNIGTCYLKQNDLNTALLYLLKAEKMLKELANKDIRVDTYMSLAELHKLKGDYKQAFEYQTMYAELKDTLFDERSSEKMLEMNTKYESEKKDKELIQKDAEIIRQQGETDKQRILRNAFIVGFLLVLVFSFFTYKAYRQKQKANKLLDKKNELITDSINYARRIQESILPPLTEIKKHIPDFFVFYQPKDIVSGDFYWFSVINDGTENTAVMLAAVDCTGHGVPGAFMSMMAYNLLEQIVKKNHVTQPAEVLKELNMLTSEVLQQHNVQGNVNDGMDMALIKLSSYELQYAGARNSLYIIRNGSLLEFKADKFSVGILTEKSYSYKNHTVKLVKGDCVYLFTDGFPDQFGGGNGEKFYYQSFRELLLRISSLSIEEQKQQIQAAFVEWKGNHSQTDDVLVLGVRIS